MQKRKKKSAKLKVSSLKRLTKLIAGMTKGKIKIPVIAQTDT